MQDVLYYVRKYGRDVALFSLLIICLAFMIYQTFFQEEDNLSSELVASTAPIAINQEEEAKTEEAITKVHVDVKGAVKKPGVFEVQTNAIIKDVIDLAGGFNSNAYQNGINLSKKVKDEMVIYVYSKNEISNYKKNQTTNINDVTSKTNEVCSTTDYNILDCVDAKVSIIEQSMNDKNDTSTKIESSLDDKEKETSNQTTNSKVNINTASESELTTLSGIGDAKAKSIIDYRNQNGKFSNITDIMNVSGIGEALYAKIKDFITV